MNQIPPRICLGDISGASDDVRLVVVIAGTLLSPRSFHWATEPLSVFNPMGLTQTVPGGGDGVNEVIADGLSGVFWKILPP